MQGRKKEPAAPRWGRGERFRKMAGYDGLWLLSSRLDGGTLASVKRLICVDERRVPA